jgi:hypothetical protein
MINNDQQFVDYLYNNIFVQLLRFNHFDSAGKQSTNSIWNKYSDEKKILDIFVDRYKKYYKNKAESLKPILHKIKETNIHSFLTYDIDYHILQYNTRIEEIDKYLSELEFQTLNHISKHKLSFISETLNTQFPGYLSDPTLLGKLHT